MAPELDDTGFEVSVPPSNETDSCEAPRSKHMAGREAVELGPFWLLLTKPGIQSDDHPVLYLGLRRKGALGKPRDGYQRPLRRVLKMGIIG